MRPRAQLWLPTAPARPEDPRGRRAKVHARLQGRRGAGFGGDLGAVEARRGGGRQWRRQGQGQGTGGPEGGWLGPRQGRKNICQRPPG